MTDHPAIRTGGDAQAAEPGTSESRPGRAEQPESSQQAADCTATPAGPLEKLLAQREALCRELESTWGTAIDKVLVESPGAPAVSAKPKETLRKDARGTPSDEPQERIRTIEERLRASERQRGDLAARLEQQAAENVELRQTCADQVAKSAELTAALEEARAALRQPAPPPAAPQPDASELAARYAKLQAAHEELLASRERERRSHVEETASLTRQISQLRQRYEAQIAALARERQPHVAEGSAKEGPAASEQPAPAAPLRSTRGRARATEEMIILDDSEIGEETAQRLAQFGHPATAFSITSDPAAELAGRNIVCLAVNVALPSSWRAVRALRRLGENGDAPVVAYALARRAESGFWFGNVDFALMPGGNGSMLRILRRLAPGAKQVIAIGPDDGPLAAARRGLANARISVSVASDRRNALNLVRSAYPQAALVYPTPNPVDGFRAIAGIRSLAIFRDLPSVFLLDDVAQPREDERLSAGVRTTLRLGSLTSADLVGLLVDALGAARSPVQPRPPQAPPSRP